MINLKQITLGFYSLLLLPALIESWQHSAYGQSLANPPLPRCEQLLNPLYGNQILVFSPQTYEHIQRHSISQLAHRLHEQRINVSFSLNKSSGGYLIQGSMLERLLIEIFPPLQKSGQEIRDTLEIGISVVDSALRGNFYEKIPNHFEMTLLKSGNPLVAPLSKKQLKTEFNIPMNAKIASFYVDGVEDFERAFSAIEPSSQPKNIILSAKYTSFSKTYFKNKFPKYEVITLSELIDQKNWKPESDRHLILNNTSLRMAEVYTASDYAVVIGSNNIFEPLQNSRPVIYFKNNFVEHILATWSRPLGNSILTEYDPRAWKIMGNTADRTQGALGITNIYELPRAIHRIERISPKKILHPAFVIPKERVQSRFDDILDQIEELIETQLKQEGISLD